MNYGELSAFQVFEKYVFKSSIDYYYDGLPEEIFSNLSDSERKIAEKKILRSLKFWGNDVRVIRAAGYLQLHDALPFLEKKYKFRGNYLSNNKRTALSWAILKIRNDKSSIPDLIKVLEDKYTRYTLSRADAADLLGNFGVERNAVQALLNHINDSDISISISSRSSIIKIYKPIGNYFFPDTIADHRIEQIVQDLKDYLKL